MGEVDVVRAAIGDELDGRARVAVHHAREQVRDVIAPLGATRLDAQHVLLDEFDDRQRIVLRILEEVQQLLGEAVARAAAHAVHRDVGAGRLGPDFDRAGREDQLLLADALAFLFALTTPCPAYEQDDRCGLARAYNEVAAAVCRELAVKAVDLHAVGERNYDNQGDGAHYNETGSDALAAALERPDVKSAPFVVVFCHIPLWNTGENPFGCEEPRTKGCASWIRECYESWGPVLDAHKVQLVVAGHEHAHRWDDEIPRFSWKQVLGGGPELSIPQWGEKGNRYYPTLIEGEVKGGELVFTTLSKEGMPLLRYRTKDLTTLDHTPCQCGRTNVRMGRILGRSDDMLIIRGINVFPSQIESVILSLKEVAPQYLIIVDRKGVLDTIKVQVELRPEYFVDDYPAMERQKKMLADKLRSVLSISAQVELLPPGSIERSDGKSKHVIDNRHIE